MGFELDAKLIFSILQFLLTGFITVMAFIMSKVFIKLEPFQRLENRVQTLEQTYVQKIQHDELEKRLAKMEQAIVGMPELVQRINEELIQVRSATVHMEKTVERLERPMQIILDAAMRSDTRGS